MEFEGKEVLYVLFGFPALITLIIWFAAYTNRPERIEPPSAPPVTEAHERSVTIHAELKMPEGAVVVNNANNLPPAEIHNHPEKIVEREKLVTPGKIEVAFNPRIEWYGEVNQKAPLVPNVKPVTKEVRDLKEADPSGELLPPPKLK